MLATCVKSNINFVIVLIDWYSWWCERVVCGRRRAWCDSVTWRCLHSLWRVLNNLEVQRYHTSTTDRRRRQGLEISTWHRRLRADVSGLCHWQWGVYLESVVRRWRHKAMATKVSVEHIQTTDTVSDINLPAGDVTRGPSTDPVRRSRRGTETCSTTGRHETTARCGVTNWNIYRQSQQQTTGPVSGEWSHRWRWGATSVQPFTSTIIRPHSTRCRWLSR